ncbi:MAG: hypothetical protein ISS72_06695 [Candidatus Brocadiae bacterium]|nr:hypothetical protein [Candidatus Brocadiia bacterium]
MADGEPTCVECGRPLAGRERFEGKCAACREDELLGAAGEAAADGESARAPGDAHPRSPKRGLVLLALLVAGGAMVVVFLWPFGSGEGPEPEPTRAVRPAPAAAPTPVASPAKLPAGPVAAPRSVPVPARALAETKELLSLLAAKDYERILDNYCEPDDEDLPRVRRALDHIVVGAGAAGFRYWSRTAIRQGALKTIARLRAAGDPHPVYTTELLTHLARHPQASGAHVPAQRRARNVVIWHLTGLYGGLRLAGARVAPMATRTGDHLVVGLECEGTAGGVRPGEDPRRVHWRVRPEGMVLQLALAERIETVARVLAQPVPATNPQPRSAP